MPRTLRFSEALLEAADQLLSIDPQVYIMGLGAPDPKGIFGTTLGLVDKYGPNRVMDMPTSENGMLGVAIGSALCGMRPILTHQRVDFFLLALDQLINNASKWHYMFGGKLNVPLVIRLIIGRGWGQGPQHSQTLTTLFTHIPGLKVVAPASPADAKGLLVGAVQDGNPVVFLEHRWLHDIYGEVPEEIYATPLSKARVVTQGNDLTILTYSRMVVESLKAVHWVKEKGINVDLIDLRTLKPLDKETIFQSVRKTGKVLIIDPDWKFCGYGAELSALLSEELWSDLKMPPKRLAYPDRHCPTSWALSNYFYPSTQDIAAEIYKMTGHLTEADEMLVASAEAKKSGPLDVPDASFKGPF